ncbi:hypothetical protein ACFORH_00905 [Amycolatopsis roodepoortensis]|uniref:SMI1/KNR4 family protein n=1 Tax=Amycolatopsis roodepoortensis TaxID=700274 RepID=A0ABR9L483_9PSEU|nr:hypothetical protein [Amycolatopsis roodepoortensis]MBE1575549.1 hypothetical protein [Amycolatopsis roodepoortensis]
MYSPIPVLNELKDLYDSAGDYLADGFELYDYDDKSSFPQELDDPAFLSRLIPFAQANGSGSTYAIWRADDATDLALSPVVVFGDEGGEHVIARDFTDFLRLLGFDAEIMVGHDSAYYYREEGDDHSGSHEQFVAWLRERGLTPADDPDGVVAAAQEAYGERFRAWITPFYAKVGWA